MEIFAKFGTYQPTCINDCEAADIVSSIAASAVFGPTSIPLSAAEPTQSIESQTIESSSESSTESCKDICNSDVSRQFPCLSSTESYEEKGSMPHGV